MPRVIPVVDLMGGQVVHAVAGRRTEYRPVVSQLTASPDPVEIATALLNATTADELYIADLDAILNDGVPSPTTLNLINALNCRILLDHGWHGGAMMELPRTHVVIPGERGVLPATAAAGSVYSVDLVQGRRIPGGDVHDAVKTAWDHGFRRFIVLDLAGVGVLDGLITLTVCQWIRTTFPTAEIITGGGIRNRQDIQAAGNAGVDAVLVATMLHKSMASGVA
jgi:phosphoribosylformimino-5-aminoimidazole carboxamide ribotide isomerase